MGKAGYEGIHNDKLGNLILVEDVGRRQRHPERRQAAQLVRLPLHARHAGDLTKGKLQVLQISVNGAPSSSTTRRPTVRRRADDALGATILAIHSGQPQQAKWVTIHDTAVDGTAPFDANAAAKAAKGTPLKRPENAKFVPGTDFKSFVVAETGDTSKTAGDEPGAAARAAWGALLRVDMPKAGADSATVKALVVGDQAHASFDNVAFLDKRTVLLTEDRGETLHQQANALDSLWSFDLTKPLDESTPTPSASSPRAATPRRPATSRSRSRRRRRP